MLSEVGNKISKTIESRIIKNLLILFLIILPAIIQAQVTWQQTDWSESKYEYSENLDGDTSPGDLILENETSNMVFAFAPTTWAGIWDMEKFNGKLFLAACTYPMAVNGGEIISYDYATDSFQHEYNVWEQGIIQMRIYNNKLYVPGVDSQGSWQWGNIYIYDGNSWQRKETVPNALHVIDLAFYKNKMYITTETAEGDSSVAKVFQSTNEGDSWTEVFRTGPEPKIAQNINKISEQNNLGELIGNGSRRFLFMGVYKNKLYLQSDLRDPEGKVIFCFDGNNWSTIPINDLVFSYGTFKTFNNTFYFLNKNKMHIYNGENWLSVSLPFSGGVIARALAFYKGFLYSGAENGTLYKSQTGNIWEQESVFGESNDEIESIAVYHGRLYVGTNGNLGKVFVSAAVPQGYLISNKHNFAAPIKNGNISWNALQPTDNTSLKFQIRTAKNQNELDLKQFVGPDNTSESYYSTSGENLGAHHAGDQWMQYKVFLSTEDSSLMPLLQDVTISVNLLPSTYNIFGNVCYHTSGLPVKDVKLKLSEDATDSTNTNSNGFFEFTDLEGGKNYSINPAKYGDISSSTILSYDASQAARIAINLMNNPPEEQVIAADVDKDGAVLMYDASMIGRYAAGLPALPGSQAGNWVFAPALRSYSHLNSNENNADFTAIVLGDVDGNWSSSPELIDQAKKNYFSNNWKKEKNGKIFLPFYSEKGKEIYSCDIKLYYDPTSIKFNKITKTDLSKHFKIFFNDLDNGEIRIGGFSAQPIIKQGEYLELEFEIINDSCNEHQIEIKSYRLNDDLPKSGTVTIYAEENLSGDHKHFKLHQNFPNPFNPTTTIEYEVLNSSHVIINIYDINGHLVRKLVNEKKSRGNYSITWDGKNKNNDFVSNGLYFYRLISGDNFIAKKMIRIK